MLGPLLIHYSKTKEIYKTFFETLLHKRPDLRHFLAYGTDGETALIDALAESFYTNLASTTLRKNLLKTSLEKEGY